jgi:DHA1 family multidrug resistance protein-like MFS transporter
LTPWKRTFWIVYAANLITAVGMMSFIPFFPSYLEELGVRDRAAVQLWSGVAFGAAPLAAAVMGPIWGSIGDRFNRKLMVMRAMLAITLFVGLMGFVRSPWELLALRLCQGIFSGFIPPSITLVSVAAPRGVQGRVSGSLQGALALGSIVGPLFGAFLSVHLGLRGVFLCVAALSGASALLVGLFVREQRDLDATVASFAPTAILRNAFGDLRESLRLRSVRAALLLLFCAQIGSSAINPQLELFVRDVWTGDPARLKQMTGLAFSAFAGASLFAMPAWGRLGDRMGHARALRLSAVLGALALGLHALVSAYAALFGVRLLLGMTLSGTNATSFAVVATETPVARRGSAIGAAFSARAFAMSFGAIGGGALAGWVGLRGLFATAALLVGLGVWLAPRRRSGAPAAEPQDVVGLDPDPDER